MVPLEGEFKLYETIPDDPLQFIYKITMGLIRIKLVRIASLFTFLLHVFISVVFTYEVLTSFDPDLVTTYGPMVFIFGSVNPTPDETSSRKLPFQGVMGIAVIFYIEHTIKVLLGQTLGQLWDFSITSELYARMKNEAKKFLLVVNVNNFMMATMVFFNFPMAGQNRNIYYAKYFFEKVAPSCSTYLTYLYYATFPLLGYMMLINPTLMLYITAHLKYQVYHLNELLTNIGSEYEGVEDYDLMRNETYQKKVSQQLKICVQRHRVLKYWEKKFNDTIYMPLIILMGLSIMAFISLFFGIIVKRQDTYLLRVGSTMVFASISTFFPIASGQYLTNASSKMLMNAGNCRWTSWNVSNRRTLLIFMTNAQKPFIIGTAFFLCEFPFIISGVKFISSICGFFLQLAKMKDAQEMNGDL
ncbi:hypothetical protein MTP99_013405 [Tenebrio molitor]|nr:hypothetical protein MTP99_013405 [Tenebrio molitor]